VYVCICHALTTEDVAQMRDGRAKRGTGRTGRGCGVCAPRLRALLAFGPTDAAATAEA
jgi:bacterioferritin-associated ferredoxin